MRLWTCALILLSFWVALTGAVSEARISPQSRSLSQRRKLSLGGGYSSGLKKSGTTATTPIEKKVTTARKAKVIETGRPTSVLPSVPTTKSDEMAQREIAGALNNLINMADLGTEAEPIEVSPEGILSAVKGVIAVAYVYRPKMKPDPQKATTRERRLKITKQVTEVVQNKSISVTEALLGMVRPPKRSRRRRRNSPLTTSPS